MVFVGSASDVFSCQSARLVVLTGPAADEILELHFAGSWSLLGLLGTNFSYCRLPSFEVLTGRAPDEILELHSVRFMVFAGPTSDRIFVLQIARFVVLTGPAADEFWSTIL